AEGGGEGVVHPRASEIQPWVTPCLPQVPIARYPRAVSWAWSSPAFIVISLLESSDHVTTHLPSNPPRPLRLHSRRGARRHHRHRPPDRTPPSGRPGGARVGPPDPMRRQPQAARAGLPQLRRCLWYTAHRNPTAVRPRPG